MCGIVAVVAQRDVPEILLEGLRRLEYRGYDSAGIAIVNNKGDLQSCKHPGKVAVLERALTATPVAGSTGIAHTRWATHGVPNQENAHPHISGNRIGLVHNGIIENHQVLRDSLVASGVSFSSDTDSEVIVHLINAEMDGQSSLLTAVQRVLARLEGAYALAVIDAQSPGRCVVARVGSPLVLGVGMGETYAGSDTLALRPVTDRFVYLEEGDVAELTAGSYTVYSHDGHVADRQVTTIEVSDDSSSLGDYDHYMLKEIHEQPARLQDTVAIDWCSHDCFGGNTQELLSQVQAVQIIACGTSYHAGLIARHWIEGIAGLTCQVEVASEYRYRQSVTLPGTLVVCISQSGETADTLAALKHAANDNVVARLALCNVDHSAIVRASELTILTRAGAEIGVASTKAFTTQLAALMLLSGKLAEINGRADFRREELDAALGSLPSVVKAVLGEEKAIKAMATHFAAKHHALFLGRGINNPVAMEGALKLKEISYIHAEAYAAGELKHGPLALVDADMPVVAVAPNNDLLEKLRSNLEEVRARGGELFVFADEASGFKTEPGLHVLQVPHCAEWSVPIVYSVVLQLLAYHVAIVKGTDVDKPRNLAKSVTVE
ncbi:glutamine--fructose-6-phosphate transaminase (isomerizing) [Luminiphilus sp. nBUS_16]|uniref:glutamine--fructose-6-phosphate transaminase (isomerizing) n=1 Tax=Luminiphilus sp. nBUS_16 TaxID=3395315 RepID=UPI003EC04614